MNKTSNVMAELLLGHYVTIGATEIFWDNEYSELWICHQGVSYTYAVTTAIVLEHALTAFTRGILAPDILDLDTDVKAILDCILSED